MTRSARRIRARSGAAGTALAAAGLLASPAYGDDARPPGQPGLAVDVEPVFSATSLQSGGWREFVVRLQNDSTTPRSGEVEVRLTDSRGTRGGSTSVAPYAVGAGAAAWVRLPLRVPRQLASYGGGIDVRVVDEAGKEIALHPVSSAGTDGALLVDVSEPSRLRGVLHEMPFTPEYSPLGPMSGGAPLKSQLLLGSPRVDPVSGDPILPDRAALYGSAMAVLLRSDTLTRLAGVELEALAGWVLSGGTLAVVVVRPEDMRHPTLTALVGAEPVRGAPSAEMLRELPLGLRSAAPARAPGPQVERTLVGWIGGNLRGSTYGSSASYGMGEVHLLGFDPTQRPGVDDPWVLGRVVELVRAAHDRRSTLVLADREGMADEIMRRHLDPNESSRWAIAAAAVFLCIYAILAGPVSFGAASKAGKPLRALRWLPLFSAVAFAFVVGIGIAARGMRGRARHLTLVEAGAGMTRGVAGRWRGFYASSADDLTVLPSDASSVVATAAAEANDRLVVDRDGARIVGLAALPWQTVVVREDGFASLGDGISLVADGADVVVVNRSGRALRAAILALPGGAPRYFARIHDGESVRSGAGRELGKTPDEGMWVAATSPTAAGSIYVRPLGAEYLDFVVGADAPGLADAWSALEQSAGPWVDWLPRDVPVLLAQIDGGEGRTSDAGLRLDSDRLVARVVGYGGRL